MSFDPVSPSPMGSPSALFDPRELALRAFATVGLGFSTLLLVDYARPEPVFCTEHGSGCGAVRASAFSHIGPVSTPTLGALFFAAILALAMVASLQNKRDERAEPLLTAGATNAAAGMMARLRSLGPRGLLTLLATTGALGGLSFLAVQARVLHTWCKLCVVVDTSALLVGVCAWLLQHEVRRWSAHVGVNYATGAVALAAFLAPMLYGWSQPLPEVRVAGRDTRPTPAAILREQREGVATVVEFLDFECPYCRRNQESLESVLASYRAQVRIVRKHVPLSFHAHARDAARAACCAEEQGHGDRMADALFRAEASGLTAQGCAQIAREVGLDMHGYRECLASRRPDHTIERDNELAHETGVTGLPTFWVGRERFEGPQSPETLRASIDRALHPLYPSRPETPALDASRSGT